MVTYSFLGFFQSNVFCIHILCLSMSHFYWYDHDLFIRGCYQSILLPRMKCMQIAKCKVSYQLFSEKRNKEFCGHKTLILKFKIAMQIVSAKINKDACIYDTL